MEHPTTGNSATAVISGAGLAAINSLTGLFNEPLSIINIQQDAFKALVLGFVGALGGLVAKSFYTWASKKIKSIQQ